MLKVIVTGFVGSGTSFTCQLASAMGFCPGIEKNLRTGDAVKHPTGFWEYSPLAEISAAILKPKFENFKQGKVLLESDWRVRYAKELEQIRQIVEQDNVEIYKDVALIFLYEMYEYLFPDAKWIFTTRDARTLDASRVERQRRQFELWNISAVSKKCLYVDYSEYQKDFVAVVRRISAYLGVDAIGKIQELRALYHPSPVSKGSVQPKGAEAMKIVAVFATLEPPDGRRIRLMVDESQKDKFLDALANAAKQPLPNTLTVEERKLSLGSMALAAKAMLTAAKVQDEIREERMATCLDNQGTGPCQYLKKTPQGQTFCKLCGCNVSKEVQFAIPNMAAIEEKLPQWGCKFPGRAEGKGGWKR